MSMSEIAALRKEIQKYNDAYYSDAEPLISDAEFDRKLARLRQLERKHFGIAPTNVTEQVSYSKNTIMAIAHLTPMLSLKAVNEEGKRKEFVESLQTTFPDYHSYVCEPKYDGLAISILYKKGELISAGTRGDGLVGEDVTNNIRVVANVPTRLKGVTRGVLEIRGEIVMLKEDFNRLNESRRAKDEKLFANPRNAAAGTIRHLDPKVVEERRLTFIPYSVGQHTGLGEYFPSTQSKLLDWFSEHGFSKNPWVSKAKDYAEVDALFQTFAIERAGLPFDTDGMVVKLDSFALQNEMGFTNTDPRWACAFKFANKSALAKLNGITWQVGRTGVLTPVAELEPIVIDGVRISRATLHNAAFMQELSPKGILLEGDTVLVERAGDVIPSITGFVGSGEGGKALGYPSQCPCCQNPVKFKSRDLICSSGLLCGDQLEAKILHFASRDCMDIKGLGTAIVSRLIASGYLKDISDLYRLSVIDLVNGDAVGKLVAVKLVNAIESSRFTTLPRFLTSLGIPNCGLRTSELLARKYISIDNLFKATTESLMEISGLGETTAEAIHYWFREPVNVQLILRLTLEKSEGGCGIVWKEIEIQEGVKLPLTGTNIVFTGRLETLSRGEATALVKALGAEVLPGISKRVDIVVGGDDAGSKLDMANALGIDIWDESQFLDLLRKYNH